MNAVSTNVQVDRHRQHSSRGRRLLKWIGRGLLAVLAFLFASIALGMIYESASAANDADNFPAPGQLIEVDGRTMHLNCIGEGSPTVVFEAGFGAWSDVWVLVQPEVGSFTRACSYDRAGLGWSETSSATRTPEQLASELHDLLTAATIQPPYILVGHSLAGKSIRLFADLYPEDVAGLVFVDARHESVEPTNRTPEQNEADRAAYVSSFGLHRTLRQIGIARLFGGSLARSMDASLAAYPDDVVYRLAMFGVRETTLQTIIAESAEGMANDDQLRDAHLPDGLPVMVLTADSSLEQSANWEVGQQNLVALSSNSQWVVVQNTGHNIHAMQPQSVIDAVRAVWDSATTGVPLS